MLYRSYANDILHVLDANADINSIVNTFNAANGIIQLKLEKVTNNKIVFPSTYLNIVGPMHLLNIRCTARPHAMVSTYASTITFSSKWSATWFSLLISGAWRICAGETTEKELEFFRNVFLVNGYPARFLNRTDKREEERTWGLSFLMPSHLIILPLHGTVHYTCLKWVSMVPFVRKLWEWSFPDGFRRIQSIKCDNTFRQVFEASALWGGC